MRNGAGSVLLVAGLFGAVAGLCRPVLQDAVEVAQVHAGVVDTSHPMAPLVMRLWSLQVQIPALFLHWGVSERALSAAISALMGALSFQALALTALAGGSRRPIAVLAPCVIAAFGLARGGITYPVLLFGTMYTWGAIGLSACLLAVALLSVGSLRAGAFLLALLPAVHAGLGSTTCAVVVIIAIARPSLRKDLWEARRWLLFGAVVTAASFGVHIWRAPAASVSDKADAASFLSAVLTSWDFHRQLLPVRGIVIAAAFASIGVSVAAVIRRRLEPRAELLPQFVLITAVVGVTLHLTRLLSVLMPGRLINFALLSGAALLIGLVTHDRVLRSRAPRIAVLLVFAAVTVTYLGRAITFAPKRWAAEMAVAANDSFFSKVADGRAGLLTASDIPDIQRRTRRPVVLNGAWIDTILYAPESGAAINRALIALYGVDLLNPPADSLDGLGTLPGEAGRELWERRSVDEWRRLAREWRFDQIVTYEDWTLQLPREAIGHGLALYRIPRTGAASSGFFSRSRTMMEFSPFFNHDAGQ